MKRHRVAEVVLRAVTVDRDEFSETQFLAEHKMGLGLLRRFLAEGWIVEDEQVDESYHITTKGRAGLEVLAVKDEANWRTVRK